MLVDGDVGNLVFATPNSRRTNFRKSQTALSYISNTRMYLAKTAHRVVGTHEPRFPTISLITNQSHLQCRNLHRRCLHRRQRVYGVNALQANSASCSSRVNTKGMSNLWSSASITCSKWRSMPFLASIVVACCPRARIRSSVPFALSTALAVSVFSAPSPSE